MPKYRTHKVKHEHTIIPGVRPLLERMAAADAVQAILPGVIKRHRSVRSTEITCQYRTESGLRLLARSQGAIQEVFVVTDAPDAVQKWLLEQGLIASGSASEPELERPDPAPTALPGKAVVVQFDHTCDLCGRPVQAGSRAWRSGQGSNQTIRHLRCARGR